MEILSVNNLSKSYGDINAVNSINFSVNKGEFVAFLGENGAGKSTTINIISTLLQKTSGEIKVNGYQLDKEDDEIRNNIGVVFQNRMLDDFLTVWENIYTRGSLYGLSKREIKDRVDEISKKIDINQILNRRYAKLSGGQKRRADIARAMIHKPKILILDEPTTGLDPYSRENLWDFICSMQKDTGLTVFLTTHYMEEAAKADRIIIIKKGHIVENDSPENLKMNYSQDVLKLYPKDISKMLSLLENAKTKYKKVKGYLEIYLGNHKETINLLNKVKNHIDGFEMIQGNMDQVFMKLAADNREERGQ